jgi:N-acyl-L-homoserine lactone synthetase
MNQGVVLFHTTTTALRAEKIAKNAGLKVKLIPTPRELSSDCGIALRFDLPDREKIEQALAAAGVDGEIFSLNSPSP